MEWLVVLAAVAPLILSPDMPDVTVGVVNFDPYFELSVDNTIGIVTLHNNLHYAFNLTWGDEEPAIFLESITATYRATFVLTDYLSFSCGVELIVYPEGSPFGGFNMSVSWHF